MCILQNILYSSLPLPTDITNIIFNYLDSYEYITNISFIFEKNSYINIHYFNCIIPTNYLQLYYILEQVFHNPRIKIDNQMNICLYSYLYAVCGQRIYIDIDFDLLYIYNRFFDIHNDIKISVYFKYKMNTCNYICLECIYKQFNKIGINLNNIKTKKCIIL